MEAGKKKKDGSRKAASPAKSAAFDGFDDDFGDWECTKSIKGGSPSASQSKPSKSLKMKKFDLDMDLDFDLDSKFPSFDFDDSPRATGKKDAGLKSKLKLSERSFNWDDSPPRPLKGQDGSHKGKSEKAKPKFSFSGFTSPTGSFCSDGKVGSPFEQDKDNTSKSFGYCDVKMSEDGLELENAQKTRVPVADAAPCSPRSLVETVESPFVEHPPAASTENLRQARTSEPMGRFLDEEAGSFLQEKKGCDAEVASPPSSEHFPAPTKASTHFSADSEEGDRNAEEHQANEGRPSEEHHVGSQQRDFAHFSPDEEREEDDNNSDAMPLKPEGFLEEEDEVAPIEEDIALDGDILLAAKATVMEEGHLPPSPGGDRTLEAQVDALEIRKEEVANAGHKQQNSTLKAVCDVTASIEEGFNGQQMREDVEQQTVLVNRLKPIDTVNKGGKKISQTLCPAVTSRHFPPSEKSVPKASLITTRNDNPAKPAMPCLQSIGQRVSKLKIPTLTSRAVLTSTTVQKTNVAGKNTSFKLEGPSHAVLLAVAPNNRRTEQEKEMPNQNDQPAKSFTRTVQGVSNEDMHKGSAAHSAKLPSLCSLKKPLSEQIPVAVKKMTSALPRGGLSLGNNKFGESFAPPSKSVLKMPGSTIKPQVEVKKSGLDLTKGNKGKSSFMLSSYPKLQMQRSRQVEVSGVLPQTKTVVPGEDHNPIGGRAKDCTEEKIVEKKSVPDPDGGDMGQKSLLGSQEKIVEKIFPHPDGGDMGNTSLSAPNKEDMQKVETQGCNMATRGEEKQQSGVEKVQDETLAPLFTGCDMRKNDVSGLTLCEMQAGSDIPALQTFPTPEDANHNRKDQFKEKLFSVPSNGSTESGKKNILSPGHKMPTGAEVSGFQMSVTPADANHSEKEKLEEAMPIIHRNTASDADNKSFPHIGQNIQAGAEVPALQTRTTAEDGNETGKQKKVAPAAKETSNITTKIGLGRARIGSEFVRGAVLRQPLCSISGDREGKRFQSPCSLPTPASKRPKMDDGSADLRVSESQEKHTASSAHGIHLGNSNASTAACKDVVHATAAASKDMRKLHTIKEKDTTKGKMSPDLSTVDRLSDLSPGDINSYRKKAEEYTQLLEKIIAQLLRKGEEARDLQARAVMNNNQMLMMKSPKSMDKISCRNTYDLL